jgi:hypothetical protein
MTYNAAARAAALALAVAAGAGAATERSAFADGRPCTEARVSVDEVNRKVTVSFHNRCETHIGCRVQWALRCGKGSAQAREEEVRVEGRSDNAVVASGLSCGDEDWRINPPRWRCDEPDDTPVLEHSSATHKKRR